jgi:hypothetical protein
VIPGVRRWPGRCSSPSGPERRPDPFGIHADGRGEAGQFVPDPAAGETGRVMTLPGGLLRSLAGNVGEPHVLTGDAVAGFAPPRTTSSTRSARYTTENPCSFRPPSAGSRPAAAGRRVAGSPRPTSPTAKPRSCGSSHRAGPTRRSQPSCSSAWRPSRPTYATCWQSSAPETASRPSSRHMRAASSAEVLQSHLADPIPGRPWLRRRGLVMSRSGTRRLGRRRAAPGSPGLLPGP